MEEFSESKGHIGYQGLYYELEKFDNFAKSITVKNREGKIDSIKPNCKDSEQNGCYP